MCALSPPYHHLLDTLDIDILCRLYRSLINGSINPTTPPRTLKACRDACEKTSDCLHFYWIAASYFCCISPKAAAHRYDLICAGMAMEPKRPIRVERGIMDTPGNMVTPSF